MYRRDYDRPETVGRIAGYLGNVPALVKAYAWIRAIGPERIADVARYAVLNNNYVQRRLAGSPASRPRSRTTRDRRLDVVRYSLGELKEETGIGPEDVRDRITDYGLPGHWMSHHPVTSPEPFTLEPTESVVSPGARRGRLDLRARSSTRLARSPRPSAPHHTAARSPRGAPTPGRADGRPPRPPA